MIRPSDSTHHRKPSSHARPCVRTPGAGIERTIAPLSGSGFLCLKLGAFAPIVVALFHLAHGAILGAVYGKLIDTDEAREHLAHPAQR